MTSPLRGLFCPLTTPFDSRQAVYHAKIRHNVDRLNRTALRGYLVGTQTGERSLLSDRERQRLFDEVAEEADNEKQLIADVSSAGVQPALEFVASAASRGYHAVLASVPVGGQKMDEAARILLFFRTLADRSTLPVVADFSGLQACGEADLLPLARHANLGGLVCFADRATAALEAGLDPARLLAAGEADFMQLWPAGVRAGILPLANAIPFYLLSMEEALRTREHAAADELALRARPAFDSILAEFGSAGLKYAMDLRGCFGGPPRLPFTPPPAAARQRIEAALADLPS